MTRPDDTDLLTALRRLADELDKTPTISEFDGQTDYSKRQLEYRFGSYTEALLAAGLTPTRYVPVELLLGDLHRLASELGEPPTIRAVDEYGRFAGRTYLDCFGSFAEALNQAGLEPRQRRNIPEEDLRAELQRLAAELGKSPSQLDMDEHGAFSGSVYRSRWGSWTAAKEDVGV